MVAAAFRLKATVARRAWCAVGRDPVTERCVLADKYPSVLWTSALRSTHAPSINVFILVSSENPRPALYRSLKENLGRLITHVQRTSIDISHCAPEALRIAIRAC